MRRVRPFGSLLLVLTAACTSPATGSAPADLVLYGGDVYTLDPQRPWARGVVIEGNRIQAVLLEDADAAGHIGPGTRVVELDGRFVLPGFVDGHTHFNRAGALLRDANLLRVSDEAGLREELARVAGILEEGEWITGGSWGAYEAWAEGAAAAGPKQERRFEPARQAIDDVTAGHPTFVQSFDRELFLANTAALEAAGLLEATHEGMQLDDAGRPTGLIRSGSPALDELRAAVQPKSRARRLDECRAALASLAASGVTEIHDITGDEQMELFHELRENGELTVRVWMRADLARAGEFERRGIRLGTHPVTGEPDRYLRWGAFKGYIDGIMGNHTALFFEPYDDQPENLGAYRHHTSDAPPYRDGNMEKMFGYLVEAHEAGFPANVHAIGTRGVALMLDTYERLLADIGGDVGGSLEGYRIIHCQVVRPSDFGRFRQLNVVAEVNPFHLSDDMRWMEERIGPERCRGAYAFRSLIDAGATLVFGSDWPGTNAAWYHEHPRYLLHAAVTRTTIQHTPAGGWFPEEKITLAEALAAYTRNGARAAFDGDVRGTLEAGKLADVVVLDQNPFELDPEEILGLEVDLTIVDGKIVFAR